MKEKKNSSRPTRTEIKDIGKMASLDRLFAGSGYTNSDVQYLNTESNTGSTKGTTSASRKGKAAKESDYLYLTTNKMLLEGIDFDLTYTPLKYLGYRAATLAMGSLYARCYEPYTLGFNIALSGKFSFEHIDWLWAGIRAAAKEHKVENITLDLTSSLTGLTIAVSAVGRISAEAAQKFPKPKANALVCVSGNLGAAYMGLHVLEREKVAFNGNEAGYKQPDLSKYKYLLERYLTPVIDADIVERFKSAGIFPVAGQFITHGLGDSVKQLARQTGCGVKIFIDKIPIATQTREMAEELNIDVLTAVVNGGDDYRMLYVIPLEEHENLRKNFQDIDIIGYLSAPDEITDKDGKPLTLSPEQSCHLITPDGKAIAVKAQGWD